MHRPHERDDRTNHQGKVGEVAVRAVDSVTCVDVSVGSSWSSLTDTLDVPALALRHLNGGEPAPLAGQRVCRL